jgi:hypothetical protein
MHGWQTKIKNSMNLREVAKREQIKNLLYFPYESVYSMTQSFERTLSQGAL